MNKYRNIKTTVNGITFDSQREAERYRELMLIQKAGQIADIEIQPSFELQPSYKKNGKTIKAIHYKADFAYYDLEKRQKVIEDVKGVKTQAYLLKKKIFEYKYPEYTLTEVI